MMMVIDDDDAKTFSFTNIKICAQQMCVILDMAGKMFGDICIYI